jgi:hypothetical protein
MLGGDRGPLCGFWRAPQNLHRDHQPARSAGVDRIQCQAHRLNSGIRVPLAGAGTGSLISSDGICSASARPAICDRESKACSPVSIRDKVGALSPQAPRSPPATYLGELRICRSRAPIVRASFLSTKAPSVPVPPPIPWSHHLGTGPR